MVGICNGFQVLTEAGLLPGALQKNAGLRFLCSTVECTVSSTSSVLTSGVPRAATLRLPINHFEGNYTCDEATLAELRGERPARAALLRQPERLHGRRSPASATGPATWSA